MAESDYVRFKREAIATTKARENQVHVHYFNKPVRYAGVWEIVKCEGCPRQIKWHRPFEDTSRISATA